jgi:hypothetical protein
MYMIMKTEKLKQDIKDYMLEPGKYQVFEQDKYSPYQNYLYKRALYGLDSLSVEELNSMCSKKRSRILNVYNRAQIVVNNYKHKVTKQLTDKLLSSLFPNSSLISEITRYDEIDSNYKNTLTFKDLSIHKDQLVDQFIMEGILPKNFLSLEK